ncbi:hypothetical protein FF38_01998 [Lucilia cuprina]|uniref:Uncharacterized protein n=1 Tax=Lucilia cuprina TaxID=7375 RepID=A0A0L0CLT1_LUCCU|nr:hypothetical protein FF38_01998 [Lucilia cuprina]
MYTYEMLGMLFTLYSKKIWRHDQSSPKLVTLLKELNYHLAGDLLLCLVTELCEASGAGKTQFRICLTHGALFPTRR